MSDRRRDPSRQGFIVEITGLAGSGKSTVAGFLREALGLGPPFRPPRLRALPVLARSAAHSAWPVLREPHPRGFWFDVGLLAQLEALAPALAAAARGPARILLDQGPLYLHAVATGFVLRGPRRERLLPRAMRAFETYGGVLDAVVWLDAPDPTLLERIESRGKEHLVKGRPPAEALALLAAYRGIYGAMLERLAARGVPIVRIDTGVGPAADAARRAASELERLGLIGAGPSA